MARRKKGRAIHGWLVLDKPVGMTSTQAVGAVRRLFDAQQGRPRRHARSAGDRRAADRARRGHQDRALRRRRHQALPLHGALGRRHRHRRRRGTRSPPRASCAPRARPSRPCCRASRARSCRRRPRSPPSRSTATAPTTWRARARSWSWRRERCRSIRSRSSTCRTRDTTVFEARCGKGTYVRALARDMGAELGCLGHLIALRRTRVAPFDEARGGEPRRPRGRRGAGRGRAARPAASHRGRPAGPRRRSASARTMPPACCAGRRC